MVPNRKRNPLIRIYDEYGPRILFYSGERPSGVIPQVVRLGEIDRVQSRLRVKIRMNNTTIQEKN